MITQLHWIHIFYNISTKTATIKAGDISSDNIVIDFKNTNELDKSKRYVLPVTILDASNIDVLESAVLLISYLRVLPLLM
mgnify:CR=1 FL=1